MRIQYFHPDRNKSSHEVAHPTLSRHAKFFRYSAIFAFTVALLCLARFIFQAKLNADLLAAVEKNDVTHAKSLLERGADPNARQTGLRASLRDCLTNREALGLRSPCALQIALSERHYKKYPDTNIAMLLIQHGANVDIHGDHGENIFAMFVETKNFDKDLLKILLIQKHLRPIFVDPLAVTDGNSLWAHALYNNNLRLVEALTEDGLDPNGPACPLWEAVETGELEIVEYLLKAGANPNATNVDHRSVLHMACEAEYEPGNFINPPKQCAKVVNILVQYGADPYLADKHGETPITEAKRLGRSYLLPILKQTQSKHVPHR